jgi:hypothetical protein
MLRSFLDESMLNSYPDKLVLRSCRDELMLNSYPDELMLRSCRAELVLEVKGLRIQVSGLGNWDSGIEYTPSSNLNPF